ncbi:MAG TPA: helix-turn-helix transcriptional regulator [Lutibacter sp.]
MNNWQEELTVIIDRLFPDQVKVYDISSLDKKMNSNSMLHQHFLEPLSEENQEELVRQIAGFLNKQDEEAVYSFFWGDSKAADFEAKWYVSSASLKKNENGTLQKIVFFTYDLELLGEYKEKLYQVIKDMDFLKNNYNKVSLLTKRETEIMGLLAMGKTSVEIGFKLFISDHTVNTHRKNINKKLEIKTLADLMKFATIFDLTTNKNQVICSPT